MKEFKLSPVLSDPVLRNTVIIMCIASLIKKIISLTITKTLIVFMLLTFTSVEVFRPVPELLAFGRFSKS